MLLVKSRERGYRRIEEFDSDVGLERYNLMSILHMLGLIFRRSLQNMMKKTAEIDVHDIKVKRDNILNQFFNWGKASYSTHVEDSRLLMRATCSVAVVSRTFLLLTK